MSFQFVLWHSYVWCAPLWRDCLLKMKWACLVTKELIYSLHNEKNNQYCWLVYKLKHKLVSQFRFATLSFHMPNCFCFCVVRLTFASSFFSLEKCFVFTKPLITTACYTPTISIQSNRRGEKSQQQNWIQLAHLHTVKSHHFNHPTRIWFHVNYFFSLCYA